MISKNEHVMTGYYDKSGEEVCLITANEMETMFFFYEKDGNDYRKLGKATSPPELERKFNVLKRMGIKP